MDEYLQNNPGNDNFGGNKAPAKTNGLAIASLVLGIIGIPFVCCAYLGVIPGIIAIILGFLAKNKINESNGAEKGSGLATAGLIMGIATIVLAIILFLISRSMSENLPNYLEELMRQIENANN